VSRHWLLSASVAGALLMPMEPCSSETLSEREAWQASVAAAKARAVENRKRALEASRRPRDPELERQQSDRAASEAALHDPSLRRGDIISTVDGFLMFMGTGDEGGPPTLVPIPRRQRP
jgi:hypothetical protein